VTHQPLDDLTFHHVLVAVDGSADSQLALAAALITVQRTHAKLTLIAVADDVLRRPGAIAFDPLLQQRVDESTQEHLRDAVDAVPQDVPVTTLFRRGRPGPEIVAAAKTGVYDAIMLGARGVGRVHGLMGSVSQHVLHHADTAVFVTHAPRDR
jgi:nucleotide-binding universal stress UspA family protein